MTEAHLVLPSQHFVLRLVNFGQYRPEGENFETITLMQPTNPFVLGLGISTQSLSAAIINADTGEVLCCFSANYADVVNTYGAVNGVLPNADPKLALSDPRMWIEGLDWVFGELVKRNMPLDQLGAIAVNAQQHATVYFRPEYRGALTEIRSGSAADLVSVIAPHLSRQTSPIWLDASTGDDADFLNATIGPQKMVELTGSAPALRFPALQIRRFARTNPGDYAATGNIQILSAFLASLLCGDVVPADYGDGSGTNMLSPANKRWVPEVVSLLGDDAASRIGDEPVNPAAPAGSIAGYFVNRYGVNPDAVIMPGTGDNPDSALGTGLIRPGLFSLSLGTSTVLTGITSEPVVNPDGFGHLFISGAGQYMPLLCFANGALTFEAAARYFGITKADGKIDWPEVGRMLGQTPPSSDGGLIIPWSVPEITPIVLKPGLRHYGPRTESIPVFLKRLAEGQALAVKTHSAWMGSPTQLRATGGASVDESILQIYADIFGVPIVRSDSSNGAVIGSALRAALGSLGVAPDDANWVSLVENVTAPVGDAITPQPGHVQAYARQVEHYLEAEKAALAAAQ